MKFNIFDWIATGPIRLTTPCFMSLLIVILTAFALFFNSVSNEVVKTEPQGVVKVLITEIDPPKHFRVTYFDFKNKMSYTESRKHCNTWDEVGLKVGDTIKVTIFKNTRKHGEVSYYYSGALDLFCK